jgi:glutathione peroxidase
MGSLVFKKGSDKLTPKIANTMAQIKFKEIEVQDIDGLDKKIDDYLKNKKALIVVNVASECGYTNANYKELQEIYE